MASRRVRGLPLLALLALASVVLLLSAHSFAEGQPAQRPVGDEVDGAEHDAGDHTSVSKPLELCDNMHVCGVHAE